MLYIFILFISIICIGIGVKLVSLNNETKFHMNNEKKSQLYLLGCILSLVISIIAFSIFARPFYLENFKMMEHNTESFLSLIILGIFGNLAKWLYSQYKRLNTGIKGERKTQKALLNLPSEYQILSNISIQYENQKSEIDNLILSPRGIVIVETKSYKGTLKGKEEDNEWEYIKTSQQGREYSSKIRSPLKQIKRQTYILSKLLNENQIHCWVDAYVYILESQCYIASEKIFLDERSLVHRIVSSGKENALKDTDINKIKSILKNQQ